MKKVMITLEDNSDAHSVYREVPGILVDWLKELARELCDNEDVYDAFLRVVEVEDED